MGVVVGVVAAEAGGGDELGTVGPAGVGLAAFGVGTVGDPSGGT